MRQPRRVVVYRRSRLATAVLAATCGMAIPVAWAQQAAPPATPDTPAPPAQDTAPASQAQPTQQQALDTITVVGIRGTIQSSIERKREETVVADVISAEDIGDLPATSIGEAIETITGAATHREKGGASEISVRGLGPFLGSASFNGREASNGSGDRSVNFNQFPSELINSVSVYKTQRADFIEGGVAGTINMETVKPLDYGKRRIQLEGRALYSGDQGKRNGSAPFFDSGKLGWRGTASYIDQFTLKNGGELGVSLGIQSLETSNPEEMISNSTTWSACNNNVNSSATTNCAALTPAAYDAAGRPPYYLVPGSRTYRTIIDKDTRDAVFGAVQWRPSDTVEVNLDYQWSDRTYTEDRNDLNFSEALRGIANRVVDPNGTLRHYTGNSTIESTPTYRIRTEQYHGGGFNLAWRPSEAWAFSTDLGYSSTFRSEMDRQVRLRSNATDIYGVAVPGVINGQRVNYTFDYSGQVPGIYVDPRFDLNDHDNFSAAARLRRDETIREHKIKSARFDTTYTPASTSFFSAIKGGLRVSQATYADSDDRVEINSTSPAAIRAANLACRREFVQDDFLSGQSGNTINSWAQFDPLCLFRAFSPGGVDDTGRSGLVSTLLGARDVTERTRAAYLMGEFASEWFGRPVTGNLGVRFVETKVRSFGRRAGLRVVNNPDATVSLVATGPVSSEVVKSDSFEALPSFNAALQLNDSQVLRLGLYRAMSRPDLSSLGVGAAVTGVNSYASAGDAIADIQSAGNPRIPPLMSWNADVSWEWYPNKDSILAAAVYYKQFNGGFRPTLVTQTLDINGSLVPVPVQVDTTTDEKSDLWGFELTAAHRFSYLPKPFDGLGFKASYNYAWSDFKTEDLRLGEQLDAQTGAVTPGIVEPAGIFGLSKHVFSGSLYYEIGPIELQAIYKYRSEYYQKFVGAPNQNRYVGDTGVFDFRATWRVNRQLSFSFEGLNLNDEPRVSSMPIPGSFREISVYGPRYYLGARYRF